VAFLCRRYQVSRSGFYAWAGRDDSQRQRNDEELGARIERIHRDSGARYGSPRVHEVLRREGLRCSNKRVARLMRELGLRARVSRLYRKGSGVVRRFFAKTGNLRLDEPLPTRTDQIWVGGSHVPASGQALALPGHGDGSVLAAHHRLDAGTQPHH